MNGFIYGSSFYWVILVGDQQETIIGEVSFPKKVKEGLEV